MKSLDGLWKDVHCELLIQLHSAAIRELRGGSSGSLMGFKAVARVVKGDEERMNNSMTLVSVLPKQTVKICITDASQRGPTMWNIDGIAVGKQIGLNKDGMVGPQVMEVHL